MKNIFNKSRYAFSQSTPDTVLQTAYSVFQSGKSSISLSQHVIHPQTCKLNSFSNYYVHHTQCGKLDPSFNAVSLDPYSSSNPVQLKKILRIIIQAQIGNKQINLNINSLRKNKIIEDLIALQMRNKYAAKSSTIIIDDQVSDNAENQAELTKRLQNNITEVQKLLQTGFNLSLAYALSNKNIHSKIWQQILKRKNKAINSNIIQKLGHKSQKHKSFQQFIFNNGFRLKHIFLNPYKDGVRVQSLQQANNFDLNEFANVLKIIDFQGKVILQNNQKFRENIMILQQTFRKAGFLKKKLGQSQGPLWYTFL